MAAIINGKNGIPFLLCGMLLVVGGLWTVNHLAKEGYEPTIKFCGAELQLSKHHEVALPATDTEAKPTNEAVTSDKVQSAAVES